jgi:hypothetical protein
MPGVKPALHEQSLTFVLALRENEASGHATQSSPGAPLLTVALKVPAAHATHVS